MTQYERTPGWVGIGLNERNLHQSTGLRDERLSAMISTNLLGIVATTVIGAADAPSDTGQFPAFGLSESAFTVWNPNLPVPMTPSIFLYPVPISFALPAVVQFKIRAIGKDQFGAQIEEITPWLTTTLTTTSLFRVLTLSKVFASLDEVFVATLGVSNIGGLSQAAVGWHTMIDPTRGAAAAIAFTNYNGGGQPWNLLGSATSNVDMMGTWQNWGIGTRLTMEPYGKSMPFPSPEICGAMGTILRQKTTPTVINNSQKLPARGQLSVAGVAPVTGLAIGRSLAGFQQCPHKIGFFSNDSWATKIANIDFGGSSLRAGGVPLLDVQLGEDELMFTALLRTTMSTQRHNSPAKSYPD